MLQQKCSKRVKVYKNPKELTESAIVLSTVASAQTLSSVGHVVGTPAMLACIRPPSDKINIRMICVTQIKI
jgi:hypothetical protein